ncbi:MAG: flagellar protein FlaG [Woeseia sp.]|nr:flagellar protein FlaG [Woeseia sp.]NNE60044.1 flagellar protein FlaG [Woeseia sp.]NNL54255.1 flagellar protein FlaG [Woeseia sp.]
MSEVILGSISGTGEYPALVTPARQAPAAGSGKEDAKTGKELPAQAEKPDLKQVAEQLNMKSQNIGRDLRFEVNLDSGRSVIQVLDRQTGEIIRQIPPEKVTPYMQENGALAMRLYDEVV